MAIGLLAIGWGLVGFAGAQRIVVRVASAERARRLRSSPSGFRSPRDRRGARMEMLLDLTGSPGRVLRGVARHRAARQRDDRLARELPAAVDLLAVAVSSGATPFGAVELAARWAPPAVARAFESVLATCALGASFETALAGAARRDPRLAPLAAVMTTGARLGAAVNDPLARLAAESRRDLRRRAEARARTVPVRLLFPLVFLVLPAFGLLTVVPAVAAGFQGF